MTGKTLIKWISILPALTLGIQTEAFAHRVVHVQGTLYVVTCEPSGGSFTFNGTAQGANEIGDYMCAKAITNSGVGTPNGSVPRSSHQGAMAAGRGKGGATVKECPKGTHWYEPAKACVANGGHPSL